MDSYLSVDEWKRPSEMDDAGEDWLLWGPYGIRPAGVK